MVGLQVNRISGRARAAGDARPSVRSSTSVDLTLRSDPARGEWVAVLTLRDLFDADIRKPSLAPG